MAARQPLFPASSVPWLATGGALAALCVAWLAQYGFGLAPCELCYWQRYGYWAAIALGVVAILQPARTARRTVALWLLALAFLATAGIALFHVGVEQKWWQGFTSLHRRDHRRHDAGGTAEGDRERADRALRRAGLDHVRNLHGGL